MAFLLGCENVSLEYPTRRVFDEVTIGIDEGARIGIVGRNGEGKSSLLGLLAGRVEPDSGRITRRGTPDIGLLEQTDSLSDDDTVSQVVVGDAPVYTWAADPRVRDILDGLLVDVDWHAPVGTLSGGQRRKVDLARLLVSDHDVLLLDEPTNHLDVGTIDWLADHLKHRWRDRCGALLVVTHDRWFLDEVCLDMWEVHDRRVEPFEGGYSAYVLQRVQREEAERRAEQKRRNLMRRELAWLSRGARARSSKPKFHLEAARAIVEEDPPVRIPLELRRTAISHMGKRIIDFEDCTVRIGGRTVLDDITWRIGPGDRFGILGANGAGKTTLLNAAEGLVEPTSGRVRIGQTVKFSHLTQRLDELEQHRDERVRDILATYKTTYEIDGREVGPSKLLEHLGFQKAHLSSYVRDLSGGQRRRLQLMLILLDQPNVLLLDEPGNDLDTDMLVLLENLLDTWPGTILLVTHDRYLMDRVCDDEFALIDGKIRHVPGGVDEYLELLHDRPRQRGSWEQDVEDAGAGADAEDARETTSQTPRLSQSELRTLRKQVASTERKLSTQHAKLDDIREQMRQADPTDFVVLGDLENSLQEVQRRIDELEDQWLELSDRLP
ncbi:MAG: ABC-F family ATP-binding cassette domain-containing protein [Coriobacteriales bacterium]